MIDKKKQGKKNRAMGADFERRVRADLESKDWIVTKWINNIKNNKCVSARPSKFRLQGTGFPDFIVYKEETAVIFIECKVNGYMNKEEKKKAQWYLGRGYCYRFYVASKEKFNNRVHIIYKEVEREWKTEQPKNK